MEIDGVEYDVMQNCMNTDTQNTNAPDVFASEGLHNRRLQQLHGHNVVEIERPDQESHAVLESDLTVADHVRTDFMTRESLSTRIGETWSIRNGKKDANLAYQPNFMDTPEAVDLVSTLADSDIAGVANPAINQRWNRSSVRSTSARTLSSTTGETVVERMDGQTSGTSHHSVRPSQGGRQRSLGFTNRASTADTKQGGSRLTAVYGGSFRKTDQAHSRVHGSQAPSANQVRHVKGAVKLVENPLHPSRVTSVQALGYTAEKTRALSIEEVHKIVIDAVQRSQTSTMTTTSSRSSEKGRTHRQDSSKDARAFSQEVKTHVEAMFKNLESNDVHKTMKTMQNYSRSEITQVVQDTLQRSLESLASHKSQSTMKSSTRNPAKPGVQQTIQHFLNGILNKRETGPNATRSAVTPGAKAAASHAEEGLSSFGSEHLDSGRQDSIKSTLVAAMKHALETMETSKRESFAGRPIGYAGANVGTQRSTESTRTVSSLREHSLRPRVANADTTMGGSDLSRSSVTGMRSTLEQNPLLRTATTFGPMTMGRVSEN